MTDTPASWTTLHLPRKVTAQESTALQAKLRPLLLQGQTADSEDVNDLLEYTLAMVSNQKPLEYVVKELQNMEMEFCPPAVSKRIGEELQGFLERAATETSERQPPADDAQTNAQGASTGTRDNPNESTAAEIEKPPAESSSGDPAASRVVSLKSTTRENALTMSGALGASRQGGKSNQSNRSSDNNNSRKNEGRNKKKQQETAGRDGKGDRKKQGDNRKNDIRAQAFDRLSQRNDGRRGGDHGRTNDHNDRDSARGNHDRGDDRRRQLNNNRHDGNRDRDQPGGGRGNRGRGERGNRTGRGGGGRGGGRRDDYRDGGRHNDDGYEREDGRDHHQHRSGQRRSHDEFLSDEPDYVETPTNDRGYDDRNDDYRDGNYRGGRGYRGGGGRGRGRGRDFGGRYSSSHHHQGQRHSEDYDQSPKRQRTDQGGRQRDGANEFAPSDNTSSEAGHENPAEMVVDREGDKGGEGHYDEGGYNDQYNYHGARDFYQPRGRGYRGGYRGRGYRGGYYGGRGRSFGAPGSQFPSAGGDNTAAGGDGDPTTEAAAHHPSPIVAAAFRGRGYRGRGYRGGGRGFPGRTDVKSMIAAKTWVRKADDGSKTESAPSNSGDSSGPAAAT